MQWLAIGVQKQNENQTNKNAPLFRSKHHVRTPLAQNILTTTRVIQLNFLTGHSVSDDD
jgi:hypothetical protein